MTSSSIYQPFDSPDGPQVPGRLLDTKAASRFLGVSKSFLNKKRVAGGGPVFCKVGRRVLYEFGDLQRWVADRRFSSTSEFQ